MKPKALFASGALAGFVAALLVGWLVVSTIEVTPPAQDEPEATPAPQPDTGHEGDCTSE